MTVGWGECGRGMGVIGIITCEILENELAHLLATDPELAAITVLVDATSAGLLRALESRKARNTRAIPHLNGFYPGPPGELEVVIRVLEVALHRQRAILQRRLMAAAHELRPHVNALLLGYGSCGGALRNATTLLDVDLPVFLPMDQEAPVDDCVGLLLGSRERYHAEQRRVPGTFFVTPGWARQWKRVLGDGGHGAGGAGLKRLFARYERSLLIVTPAVPEDDMRRAIEEFNELLGLRCESSPGTLAILARAWIAVKACVRSRAGCRGEGIDDADGA